VLKSNFGIGRRWKYALKGSVMPAPVNLFMAIIVETAVKIGWKWMLIK
jgi:hypothetical protein